MALHQSTICMGCWEHLHLPVPLRGVVSVPFRAFGIRPSRMNPNTCTICEMMFEKVMKRRHVTIDATVLFADLRGYTNLSQSRTAEAVSTLLDTFYDECASAIWEHDGILNKTMGDGLLALFNFPISHDDHAVRALRAARQIQARWHDIGQTLPEASGQNLGVGIGIDLRKPLKALMSTRLDARIRDKATGAVLWEGHADIATRDGDPHWTDQAIAGKLAAALFSGFPGKNGETIRG